MYLTPYHARMIANNIDYNWNGRVESHELSFRNNSKRLADYDRNGSVSTDELAWSLQRGDIYVTSDRKAYPAYQQYPGYGNPGHGYPSPYPNPGYGYPMAPHIPPAPQGPGYPYGGGYGGGYGYNRGYGASNSDVIAGTVVGAAAGAGVGYVVGGSDSVGAGAVIGGALGFISQVFR
ncbi:MAG: hypothetical protein ACAI44_20355 [Candidatus Sericytochromatia bacterium]